MITSVYQNDCNFSAFSDKCMNYRNEERNSTLFLEMTVTSDKKWGVAGAVYMYTAIFAAVTSLNYVCSKNCISELNRVGRQY